MDGSYGILAPAQADQLSALWSQRKHLLNLTQEISYATVRLSVSDPGARWSSTAKRAYRERVLEIVHDLHTVLDYLNAAQDQIWLCIRQLQAEGQE